MTVLRYLASEPSAYFSGSEKTSAFSLGLSYISQLKPKGFYGEAYEAARDFLGFASDVSYEVDAEAICLLQTLAGSCARMIGEKEASIVFINDALPTLRQLGQKAKLAGALVVLAMALQGLSRNEEAIKVAEEIIDIVPRESSDYFQAKAILAELDSDKDAKIRKLKPLRSRARNLGFHTVADNITLELVNESDDTEEKLRLLGDIKSRGDREYNYVRATIRRVETLLASGREQEITTIDQRDLWRSYNLAYVSLSALKRASYERL
jgi:tetratricopeptide (TPR) repeat protein